MAEPERASTAVATPPDAAVEPRTVISFVAARWDLVLRLGLLGIIIILAIFFQLRAQGFTSSTNLQNIARQMSVTGVIAVGETFVIITAGIDLSVGSTLGFTALLSSEALVNGWPLGPAILMALAVGAFIGLFNGVLVDTQKLPPFIVTLGMLSVLRGITNIVANGVDITFTNTPFTNFGINSTFGIPDLFWVLIAVCIVAAILLHFSQVGRHIYALGSNYEGARLAGINVRRTTILVYAISGFLAAVGGVLITARLGLGDPQSGTGYELDAIAATVLGGASLFGARGTIAGTFMGVLLVNMIENGVNLLNVSSFYAQVVEGALLILVVWVDQWRKRKLAL